MTKAIEVHHYKQKKKKGENVNVDILAVIGQRRKSLNMPQERIHFCTNQYIKSSAHSLLKLYLKPANPLHTILSVSPSTGKTNK